MRENVINFDENDRNFLKIISLERRSPYGASFFKIVRCGKRSSGRTKESRTSSPYTTASCGTKNEKKTLNETVNYRLKRAEPDGMAGGRTREPCRTDTKLTKTYIFKKARWPKSRGMFSTFGRTTHDDHQTIETKRT